MPRRATGSLQKKKQKKASKNSRCNDSRKSARRGSKTGLVIEEEDGSSSQKAVYEKKSKFVKVLLDHKAKEGAKVRQKNGGRMPDSWYPEAIKSLKSNPGCSNIDFKRSDLQNRVRKIVRETQN